MVWLLVMLAGLYASVETVTRLEFPRISRIQRRISNEYLQARTLQPVLNGKPTMLLVGNSLLLEGLDFRKFRSNLAPDYEVSRFIVEQTQYLDWYFGLRRLFHEGCRPKVLVVCLSTDHLLSSGTRGEYFAYFQMEAGDIFAVAREAKLDITTASTYWLANESAWLGSEGEIRKWLLIQLMPNIVLFTNRLQTPDPPQHAEAMVEAGLLPRLRALREMSDKQGTRLILVMPPTLDPDDGVQGVISAGGNLGVPVLVPYAPAEMPATLFRDGFHLTEEGAAAFTERLEKELPAALGAK